MKIAQQSFFVSTSGRGTYDITAEVQETVRESGIAIGICHVFVHHTSASLLLCENADPTVRSDLEAFMARLAPDGDPLFRHVAEGSDDMPAHIRTILTNPNLSAPVRDHRCELGVWQGIYLWEHRTQGHRRQVTATVQGQ